jgi:hypothetical protein
MNEKTTLTLGKLLGGNKVTELSHLCNAIVA